MTSSTLLTIHHLFCLIVILPPLCEGLVGGSSLRFMRSPVSSRYHDAERPSWRSSSHLSPLKSSKSATNLELESRHIVNGVECVEVPMDIPSIGRVVVLEATAEAQDVLVNLALEDETTTSTSSLNAGDPYGAVLWPAAYAVAAKMMEESYQSQLPHSVVLELGTGTGLVSLALSLAGAKKVIASDYEAIPLQLLEYAADNLNDICSDDPITYQLLDMRDYATPLPVADLVVAADIMYEPQTGIAMARRAVEAMQQGAKVLVGDSPGRPGRGAFLEELTRLGVVDATFVETVGYTCSGDRHELICGKDSTSVSETPQELLVAIMELDPSVNLSQGET